MFSHTAWTTITCSFRELLMKTAGLLIHPGFSAHVTAAWLSCDESCYRLTLTSAGVIVTGVTLQGRLGGVQKCGRFAAAPYSL